MRRFGLILFVCLAAACTKGPEEEVFHHSAQLTDGFRLQGGVLITENHILTHTSLVDGVDDVRCKFASEDKKADCRVIKRDAEIATALVYVRKEKFDGPSIGEAAELEDGAILTALVLEGNEWQIRTGTLEGWRYHEGNAYLQSNLDLTRDHVGAGVFGPGGKLVGLVSFTRGVKLTYILPIEYATNGERALTAHPDTRRAIGTHGDSDAFGVQRVEALEHPGPLATPLKFETVSYMAGFSTTALLAEVTILDKKDDPAHKKTIKFVFEAVNAENVARTLVEGTVDPGQVSWATGEALTDEVKTALEGSYGADYVAEHFAPYDYGLLRLRVPFAPFCPKVTGEEVHNLSLTLADGRTTGKLGFSDMVNVCTGQNEGDGTVWEEQWGMAPAGGADAPAEDAAAPEDAPRKGKAKAKKGKKGKRRKKRRR